MHCHRHADGDFTWEHKAFLRTTTDYWKSLLTNKSSVGIHKSDKFLISHSSGNKVVQSLGPAAAPLSWDWKDGWCIHANVKTMRNRPVQPLTPIRLFVCSNLAYWPSMAPLLVSVAINFQHFFEGKQFTLCTALLLEEVNWFHPYMQLSQLYHIKFCYLQPEIHPLLFCMLII